MHVGGAPLGAAPATPVPNVAAGAMGDVSIELTAPEKAGRHCGYFRLATSEGRRFGHRIWVDILVANVAVPAPAPVAIPAVPVAAPVAEPLPVAVDAGDVTAAEMAEIARMEAESAVAAPSKWSAELQQLKDMGFNNEEEVMLSLLDIHGGNIGDVITNYFNNRS